MIGYTGNVLINLNGGKYFLFLLFFPFIRTKNHRIISSFDRNCAHFIKIFEVLITCNHRIIYQSSVILSFFFFFEEIFHIFAEENTIQIGKCDGL